MVMGVAAPARGDTSPPNTFAAGTTISASQVNQNFTALATAMPAATAIYNYNTGNLAGTSIALIGLTLTPPTDGVVVVTGAAKYTITQSATGDDTVLAALEMTAGGSSVASPDVRLRVNTMGGVAQAALTSTLTASHVFTVTGGVATTFKLWAGKTGSATASYAQPLMDVVFVPNRLACIAAAGTYNYGCD